MIAFKNTKKHYKNGKNVCRALDGINLAINDGEFVAVCGKSGSGKSTLLNVLGGIIKPTEGEVLIDGKEIGGLSDSGLADFRRNTVGIVLQSFGLLEKYSVEENILVALTFSKMSSAEKKKKIQAILEKLDISALKNKKVGKLSGGEKQRVAIAKAIINDPKIILADEPTGSLDSENTAVVMEILSSLNKQGKTIVLITHDSDIADFASRKIVLKDGKIAD